MDEGNELDNLSELDFDNLGSDNNMNTSPQYLAPKDTDLETDIVNDLLPNEGELLELENNDIGDPGQIPLQNDSNELGDVGLGNEGEDTSYANDAFIENSTKEQYDSKERNLLQSSTALILNNQNEQDENLVMSQANDESSIPESNENELSDSGQLEASIVDLLSDAEVEPRQTSVIELESEDEIENLEDDNPESHSILSVYKHAKNAVEAVIGKDQELLDFEEEAEADADVEAEEEDASYNEHKEQELQISVFQDSDDDLQEVSRSHFEKIEKFAPTLQNYGEKDSQIASNLELLMQNPVYIVVGGDRYLLAPCHKNQNEEEKNVISLFTWDEVLECNIFEFSQVLRQNDGLFSAYNFDPEDEIKLRFQELDLTITEDSKFANELKLSDILMIYFKLRENSVGDEGSERKLTLHVSMQKRFSAQLKKLQALCRDNLGLEAVIRKTATEKTHLDSEGETPDWLVKKKRKITES